jgi:hypothetical protein
MLLVLSVKYEKYTSIHTAIEITENIPAPKKMGESQD